MLESAMKKLKQRVSGCYLRLEGQGEPLWGSDFERGLSDVETREEDGAWDLRHLGPSALQRPLDHTLASHPRSCDLPTPCHLQPHTQEAHSGHRGVTDVSSACAGAHE